MKISNSSSIVPTISTETTSTYYFYNYEISYDDTITENNTSYELNYDNSLLFIPPDLNINNNSSNQTINNDSIFNENYEINNLPMPLIYILIVLVTYLIILFVIFICALYAHRRRIGYNYDDLIDEDISFNEVEVDKNDFEDEIKCEHCCTVVDDAVEKIVIEKEPCRNLSSISNDVSFSKCEIDLLLNENILKNRKFSNKKKYSPIIKKFLKIMDKKIKKTINKNVGGFVEPLLLNDVFAEIDV
jgi:hypothetical protein